MEQDEGDRELLSLLETSIRGFLAQRHSRRRPRDAAGDFPLWPQLAELGVLGQSLDEADCGAGVGPQAVALVARILGEHLVPEPYVACAAMPAALISQIPPSDLRTGLAKTLANGTERLSLAWQDAAGQVAPFPTPCRLASGGRLNGAKGFVVAPDRRVLVTAHHNDQPALALVELSAEGVTTRTRPAADGVAYAEIAFSNAPLVGGGPLLAGAAAEAAVRHALDVGLLATAAQLTGLITGLLELTLEHLRTRVQFDRRIGSFQALQHRAVDMRIGLALAEASVREAARLLQERPGTTQASAAASAAKAGASATALTVCKEAIQMHGAIGFTEESDVGLFARAALKWSSWLGGAREHRRRFVENDGELIHGG